MEQSFYFLARNSGRDKAEWADVLSGQRNQSPESHFSDHLSFLVLWTNPSEIPSMLVTAQTVILLFKEDKFLHIIHIFMQFAHWWLSPLFNILNRRHAAFGLGKPLEGCVLPTVCSPKGTLNVLKVAAEFCLV
jgi:hypothetical protein